MGKRSQKEKAEVLLSLHHDQHGDSPAVIHCHLHCPAGDADQKGRAGAQIQRACGRSRCDCGDNVVRVVALKLFVE